MSISLSAKGISKRFGKNLLFKDISVSLFRNDSLCIKGANGSGKSTLLSILACIQKPTAGTVSYSINDSVIEKEKSIEYIGFMSPLIKPYDELTAAENIHFIQRIRMDNDEIENLFKRFGLMKHRDMKVKHLSTGLLQRLKYLLAIINDPDILLLDEPGSNLDSIGKELIYSHMVPFAKDKILLVATNDKEEEKLCSEVLSLG